MAEGGKAMLLLEAVISAGHLALVLVRSSFIRTLNSFFAGDSGFGVELFQFRLRKRRWPLKISGPLEALRFGPLGSRTNLKDETEPGAHSETLIPPLGHYPQ